MLPSRPRLEKWSPDSLISAGSALGKSGDDIASAVRSLDDQIRRMPEASAWSGSAHDAATAMFGRATRASDDFAKYTSSVKSALAKGASDIGNARAALINKADAIDRTELHVSDQWVVLIKPAEMSEEKAAALQRRAEVEQVEVNRLLVAVGGADSGTAAAVQAAAKNFGFALPVPSDIGSGFPTTGPVQPADEVPNPLTMDGLMRQGIVRGEDMATIRIATAESTDKDGNHVTTLTMADGGKKVITTYDFNNTKKMEHVGSNWFDKNGNLLCHTASWVDPGTKVKYTQMDFGNNGAFFLATETPDGHRTAGWTMPDGRHGALPPDNPFFTSDAPTVVGGALTGLDAHVGGGGSLPGLTPDSVKDIGKAARYGGPALGLLTTMYKFAAAPTPHEACVAGISGVFGVGGDYAGGWGGAKLGAVVGAPFGPEVAAFTVPVFAVGGAFGGGKGMEWIGNQVGGAFCPK
ncbi:hypothetical protein A5642_12305 [Mycolicibacterium mucogenicum]|uniref:WXG100 family type VII secretion target n=2 Tax=Mycolicibacterium TaxID=1866885 RepID=A0A1A0N051_MYCMU|nr:hypothetical protein A5642_12305 [Mycolicibacterium mucogenicum]